MMKSVLACVLVIFLGTAMLYSQDAANNEENSEGDEISSAFEYHPNPTRMNALSVGGQMLMRFSEDEFSGDTKMDFVLAPDIYYFYHHGFAVGAVLQLEKHSGHYSGVDLFGFGVGVRYYINLYGHRRFLSLRLSNVFWIGEIGGDIQFKYGLGYSEFLTSNLSAEFSLDANYYGLKDRTEIKPWGDELRFMIGLGYYIY
ncbi:MAG: hypothetical protein GF310_11445 [candidate division Zixibacteria bacterium]|nr:hypothetical protein [candidate division Zixibacteria bacterium]